MSKRGVQWLVFTLLLIFLVSVQSGAQTGSAGPMIPLWAALGPGLGIASLLIVWNFRTVATLAEKAAVVDGRLGRIESRLEQHEEDLRELLRRTTRREGERP